MRSYSILSFGDVHTSPLGQDLYETVRRCDGRSVIAGRITEST